MTGDILNSIKATLYDRISNPLLGAFFVSWAFINYRLIWVLFSSASFSEKFRYIDEVLMPKPEYYAGYFVVSPAIAAWFYLYILPKISHRVYEHYQNKLKELKEIKQNIDDETPLTKEESRKIRTEIRNLELAHQDEIKRITESHKLQNIEYAELSEEVVDLRKKSEKQLSENSALLNELEKLKKKNNVSNTGGPDKNNIDNSDFNGIEKKIIEMLTKVGEGLNLDELFKSLKIPRIKFDVLIEDLKSEDLVGVFEDNDGREYVYLTTSGKRFAIKKGFV